MDKQAKLELITTVMVIGFFLAVLYHYILGKYLGFGYPHDTFLFDPSDKFRDFLNLLDYRSYYARLFKSSTAEGSVFPVMGWVITFFSLIGSAKVSLVCFLGAFTAVFAATTWFTVKGESPVVTAKNTVVLVFMSFPVLFVLDRGNFESLVYLCLLGFVSSYVHGRDLAAVSLLSLAICMKIFPAVFLLLFISDRKYGQALLTVLLTLGLTIIPLSLSPWGLQKSLSSIAFTLNSYNALYAVQDAGLDFGHSAFGLFKLLLRQCCFAGDLAPFMRPYTVTVLLFFGIVSAHIILIETELWKKIMLLVAAMCLFPHVSGDYKLLHLYLPLFLFLNTDPEKRADVRYALLFALLLIPKNYRLIIIPSHLWTASLYPGVVLDPLLLVIFMLLIIGQGVKRVRREDLLRRFSEHRQALVALLTVRVKQQ